MRFRRSWLGRNETEQPLASRSGTRSKVILNVPYHGTAGARPASTGAVQACSTVPIPAARNPTRGEAQAKSEARPPRHGEPWRVRRGCRPGPRRREARHVGYRQRPCPAGPGGGPVHVQAALRPGDASIHRSLRAPLVLRRDGDPCRSRRVPAPRDKITLEIDGCSSRERKYREEGLVRGSLQLSAVAA